MVSYYKEIFSFVKKSVFDKDIAQDVTQETFTRVIKKAEAQTIENERALLYRVAKNVMCDLYKENTKVSKVSFNDMEYVQEFNQTENKIIEEDQEKLLLKELDKLPKKRRQAFVLHIIKGYSRKEVASMMDLSLNAVEQHISRASNQIKQSLKEKEDSNFE